MYALLMLALAPGQFADSADFPRDKQKAALEATVRVNHLATRGEGSGVFVLHEAGIAYILTAAHCVPEGPGGDAVEIFVFAAESHPRPKQKLEGATVVGRMANEDLAVIRVPLAQPPPLLQVTPKYELKDEPRYPLPVFAVGCETDGAPAVVVDRVTARVPIEKPDGTRGLYWEADKPQRIGRSGGPLVDKRGYVIGICSGTKGGKGYYTHALEMFRALEKNGYRFLIPAAGKQVVPKNP